MKLDDILVEGMRTRFLTQSDRRILDGLGTNDIEDLNVLFDNNVNPYDSGGSQWKDPANLQSVLNQIGIRVPSNADMDAYLDEVWEEVEYQMEVRQEQYDEEEWGDDYRDHTEEDRMSAWNDKYQAYKNEY